MNRIDSIQRSLNLIHFNIVSVLFPNLLKIVRIEPKLNFTLFMFIN
jgi:hypothetical protein